MAPELPKENSDTPLPQELEKTLQASPAACAEALDPTDVKNLERLVADTSGGTNTLSLEKVLAKVWLRHKQSDLPPTNTSQNKPLTPEQKRLIESIWIKKKQLFS